MLKFDGQSLIQVAFDCLQKTPKKDQDWEFSDYEETVEVSITFVDKNNPEKSTTVILIPNETDVSQSQLVRISSYNAKNYEESTQNINP